MGIITLFIRNALDYIQTNLASAIIILLVGFIISYLFGRIVRKILKEIEFDTIVFNTLGLKLRLEKRLSKLITYTLYVVTVLIALTRLLIGYYILIGLCTLVGIILTISLLIGTYDFILDFISGLILKRKKKFKKGGVFFLKNIKGKITKVTLSNVIIETPDHDLLFIPNRTIRKNIKDIIRN